jgi:XTP/dITP diphosphohydrolase
VSARELRFVTRNPLKIAEATAILAGSCVTIVPFQASITELQTDNTDALVRDKALEAFDLVRQPVFVEHTGLHLNHLRGLPGGLTQVFWDTLEADRFAELFGSTPDPRVTAKTVIGYIDGKRFHRFEGEIQGRIIEAPRGPRDFQWDCVFQPEGHERTFAEMGEQKNDISMRRLALDCFASFMAAR